MLDNRFHGCLTGNHGESMNPLSLFQSLWVLGRGWESALGYWLVAGFLLRCGADSRSGGEPLVSRRPVSTDRVVAR